MITQSSVQLDKNGFNGLPGKEAVLEAIKKSGVEINPVNLPRFSFWDNNDATLVVEIAKEDLEKLHIALRSVSADEFNSKVVNGKTIVRAWWD